MDSRDSRVGILKREDLVGRAWVRIWPFSEIWSDQNMSKSIREIQQEFLRQMIVKERYCMNNMQMIRGQA